MTTLADDELNLLRWLRDFDRSNCDQEPELRVVRIWCKGNDPVADALVAAGLIALKADGESQPTLHLTTQGLSALIKAETDERFAGLDAILRRPDFYPDVAIRELARLARDQEQRLAAIEARGGPDR